MQRLKKFVLCVLMLIILISPASAPSDKKKADHSKAPVPKEEKHPDDHTTAIYHMDSTGTTELDETDNDNHGISIGAEPDDDGVFGKSKKFKGTDFVAITNNNFSIGNNISISLFVRIKHYPSENYTFFSSTQNGTIIIWFGMVGAGLSFIVQDDNGTFHNISSSSSVPLNQWIHVSAIFNGADDFMGVYQDGRLLSGGNIPNKHNDDDHDNGHDGNINCHQNVHHTNNSTVTQVCIQNMDNSTIIVGATYINQTEMYLEGNVDELVIYHADLVVIYANYTNYTFNNNTYISQEQVLLGLALIGFLMFLLVMGLVFSSGISVTSPFVAVLISFLVGIVITISMIMVFPMIYTSWAMVFFLFGTVTLILYVLMRANRIDFARPDVESLFMVLLPASSLVFFIIGGLDVISGLITSTFPPFWIS